MYNTEGLNTEIDNFTTYVKDFISFVETDLKEKLDDDDYEDSETILEDLAPKIDDIISLFEFKDESNKVEPANLDLESSDTLALDIEDFLDGWVTDIKDFYIKKQDTYDSFVSIRQGMINEVLTLCVAAERAANMSADLTDAVMEIRNDVLEKQLIIGSVIENYDNQIQAITDMIITFNEGLQISMDIKSDKVDKSNPTFRLDPIEEIGKLISNIPKIFPLITEIVDTNNTEMDASQQIVLDIDTKLDEVVKMVTVAGLFVNLSDKKREIAMKNYAPDSIQEYTGKTFNSLHTGEAKDLPKTMKSTISTVDTDKEFTPYFEELVDTYKF